ncbi:DNA 3'-5' helicase [Flavobacterium branchiophilum]|uniref:DNA 3'-5' helicase n=1 Tax=Flavobacterium branchiophilum (strain FL-15) TaxID=1034807 RepID=G2Z4X0_FLABF|nr:ATP-dependent helicase [Flavobacterium branchiophilum]CCB70682.1 ATP-dependent DNA helicase PcrA [Flavobacterium branchiophilum FL-15]
MTIQEEIINHKEGALLVMASAGSGKTRVLTERIKELLKNESEKFHVLALTFTNKAAEELKERLSDVKNIEKRAFVGTFHSFCLEVIQSHGYAINKSVQPHIFEKNEDRTNLLIQVFEKPENWDLRKHYENKDAREKQLFISNALTYISKKKKQLKGIEKFDFLDGDNEKELIQKMYSEYNDLLILQNAMDFDDVLIYAYQIFSDRPAIAKLYRNQFKYLFIDEAQDLNFAQYELLKIICNGEHRNVMMVGDVKQSLYDFNGSDYVYMKNNFIKDFNAETKKLNTNFRSSKKIIEVANSVYADAMQGSDSIVTGKFKIFDNCEDEKAEANAIVEEIKKYLKQGKYQEDGFIGDTISYKDIAILARSRYLLKNVEDLLTQEGLPSYLKKGSDSLFFDSQLMKIFDLGLRILINPVDVLHFSEILEIYSITTNISNLNNLSGLEKLKSIHNFITEDDKVLYSLLLESWTILNNQNKFNLREALVPIMSLFEVENIFKVNEPYEEYEGKTIDENTAIRFDIEELEKYYSIYARNTPAELKSLTHFKTQLSLGLILPEKEENGIVLSTIHLAKGLEYEIVFVLGLDDGSLPFYKSKQSGGKALSEEKNIFYVAVTRAKRALYLSYPKSRTMPWNPYSIKTMTPSEFLNGLKELEN